MKSIRFFATGLFLFLMTHLSAQTPTHRFFGMVSAEGGIPTGLFSSVYVFTGGASAGAGYSLSPKVAATGTLGYLSFLRKGGKTGISFLPLLGGFTYHFIPAAFISLEGGAAFATYSNGGTLACLVPGAGYQITPSISAGLNYTGVAQYGYLVGGITMRATYTF